jgi:CDP-diacylglycerol--serine O-phosphatidyltransferase
MCGMTERKYFIVSLTLADWLTLTSLLFSSLGFLFAVREKLTLAISLMLITMFVDMVDGLIARRLNLESEFGRYLDSFCDVMTYLILPLFILYQVGMQDLFSLCALFAFLVCGVLRLSRFNIIGVVEERGIAYHLGLQVIWSHLLVVLAFPAWMWLGAAARSLLIPILFTMSLLMILNLRFPKPMHYTSQTIIIFSVTLIYLSLHFAGIFTP